VRRDLLITALIFTAVGFVGGMVYNRYAPGAPSAAPAPVASAMSPEAEATLPEGHPPLNIAEEWNRLQQQADVRIEPCGVVRTQKLVYSNVSPAFKGTAIKLPSVPR